jgi:YidC/Oxa1 family membrane protein insertase
LNQAIELRHAPWTLWIKDLSAPDRLPVFGYHIPVLVILMIVTTFVLQKMTPMATADPAQQRMMMIMPLFLGVMFYNFASGLVLYWLTGNLVGLAQQTIINRKMPGPQNVQPARRPSEARD